MERAVESPESPPPAGASAYFALTGDVVSSRELENRASVQRTLTRVLEELNEGLEAALATPVKLIAGDEVQGLLHEPDAVVDVVTRIADALHPVPMAWGLGRGTVSTDWSEDVSMMDGPCLHRAREAVEIAASEGRWLVARGIEAPHGEILSALFNLIWTLRSSWTDTQLRYVREARERKQIDVAALYDVTPQAVSKALDSARFSVVVEGERTARRYLEWLGTESEPVSNGNR
ncbi:MAG: SatD family protein [Longimicrobiales bacterium]